MHGTTNIKFIYVCMYVCMYITGISANYLRLSRQCGCSIYSLWPLKMTQLHRLYCWEPNTLWYISIVKPTRCTSFSNRYCYLLASKQAAVPAWHIPVAVCTVLNSLWWTERPSKTCRAFFLISCSNLMHSLFIIFFHIPLHVSSHIVLTIRRVYCIYTASGSLYVTLLRWPFSAQAVRGLAPPVL